MSEREILIDVSRLVWRLWRGGPPTGIDRVCLAYVEHFRDRAQAVVQRGGRYHVFGAAHSDKLFNLFSKGSPGFRRRFARLAALAFAMARTMPRKRGLLYLNIGHTGLDEPTLAQWISRADLKAVYFIHDLIPLLHPEFCRAGEEEKHLKRMNNVLASASGLIGNSAATIADVESFSAARSVPVPPSVAAWIAGPPVPSDVRPRRFDRPHFIIVGTIEARKNHALLLHVWQRLVAKLGTAAPLLVIVGQRGWEADQAIALLDRAPGLKEHVVELGKSDDRELAALIAGACALLMPSFAEGFGLPVAEALELGTPVIASDLPVFHEFAGELPTYVDCLDGPAWQKTILDFVEDSPERQRQLAGMGGFAAPDWPTHFQIVERWIQTLP